MAGKTRAEAGFTLVEVVIATGIFVFIAIAGFETLRQFGTSVSQLAGRAGAAAALNIALGQLRSDAASASAVWVPAASCGNPAVSMLRRDGAGTSFTTYVFRSPALVRATAAGPIDPCAANLAPDTVLGDVSTVAVTPLAASALAAHADPVNGNPDGGLLLAAGIPSVAVDAHARDYDGATILAGNGVVEVTIDADPAEATVDLLAGNRPSGFTVVLTYACGARCQANAAASTGFPELQGLDDTTCTRRAPDLPDTSAYYAASATALSRAGRIVTAQYAVHLRYGYTFGGGESPALTVYRVGPTVLWPPAGNLSDPYPVDYTNNTVRAAGAPALAAAFGPPPDLAPNDATCDGMNAEADFRG